MTKTSQDNNQNSIIFLMHFYEYLTEKLKYRDITCIYIIKSGVCLRVTTQVFQR